jgi:transglutaminase-like putative cysteine protease
MAQSSHASMTQPLLDLTAVDLDRAGRVTYVLHQRFRYDYDGPVYDLEHRLVAVPPAQHGSMRRRLHSVQCSAPGARTTSRRDRHGNLVVRVRLSCVPGSVEFTVAAVIERGGPVVDVPLPAAALRDPRYLRPTRRTAADATLRAVAAQLRAECTDDLDFADRCCALVHDSIGYEFGATSVATTAAEAFALGRGVCQDHAHVMLALCRAVGVPARYVSGHLLGEGGSHAWVEVVVPDGAAARAVAMDPCNGCRAGARHVPVAVGRDYADVPPTSGRYTGAAVGRLTTSKRAGVIAAC